MKKKYCPKCRRERELFWFNKSPKRFDGLDGYCKECLSFLHKMNYRRLRQRNPEHLNELARSYYWNNREKCLKRAKNWRKENPKILSEVYKKSTSRYKNDLDLMVHRLYSLIKQRLKHGKHYKDRGFNICSKEEFFSVVMNDKNLIPTFELWRKYNNIRWLAPSIDRIDNSRGYEVDNIQIMSYVDNTLKALQEIRDKYK